MSPPVPTSELASQESATVQILATESCLQAALEIVRANRGAPGIDGVSIDAFADRFAGSLPELQSDLLAGTYKPLPLRTFEIPKPTGGTRVLGIPVVRDRVVLEALNLVLMPVWEPTFSPYSFAYRPGRSAQDAVSSAQRFLASGHHWVVDLDIEKFFDHVDHVRLMLRLGQRIDDPSLLDLVADFLRCGRRWPDGIYEPTREGIAQGSPLSPLLANIVLDELDREFGRRGWAFVRYADDCIIMADSEEQGREILAETEAFLANRLHLHLNRSKTRLVQPSDTSFLGFTFRLGRYGRVRRVVTREALAAFRRRIDELTCTDNSGRFEDRLHPVAQFVRGWSAYFGFAGDRTVRAARAHARMRLRAAAWQSWRTPAERQRRLIDLGIPAADAETAAFALHHPDEWGRIPALLRALPDAWFQPFGLGDSLPAPTAVAHPTFASLRTEIFKLRDENSRLRAEVARLGGDLV